MFHPRYHRLRLAKHATASWTKQDAIIPSDGRLPGHFCLWRGPAIGNGDPPVMPAALQATLQTEVARWFHSLDPVRPEEMIGLWKGVGHPSGHPLDGVPANLRWFGKRFHTDLRADALLFEGEPGRLVPVDPKFLPIRLATRSPHSAGPPRTPCVLAHQAALRAQGATATLRTLAGEGVMTAAMAYDRQPITDYFRGVNEHVIAGMMVVEHDPRP